MNDKVLTIAEARRIAAGKVAVSPAIEEPDLWLVQDDEAAEAHEPMTEADWRAFLAAW